MQVFHELSSLTLVSGPRGFVKRAREQPKNRLALRNRGPGTSVKTAKMPKSAYGECYKSCGAFRPRVPKVSLAPSKPCFRTGGNCLKRGFAPCKRLFWESHLGGPKTPLAPSLSTFGHFRCFDTCTRAAESQVWQTYSREIRSAITSHCTCPEIKCDVQS